MVVKLDEDELIEHWTLVGDELGQAAGLRPRPRRGRPRETGPPVRRPRPGTATPVLRRLAMSYLAWADAVNDVLTGTPLDWRTRQRATLLLDNLVATAAPTNVPLVNPASAKQARDTRGRGPAARPAAVSSTTCSGRRGCRPSHWPVVQPWRWHSMRPTSGLARGPDDLGCAVERHAELGPAGEALHDDAHVMEAVGLHLLTDRGHSGSAALAVRGTCETGRTRSDMAA